MKKILFIMAGLALMLTSCQKQSKMYHRPDDGKQEGPEAEIGKPLPQWQEGWLDIHNINSARGECAFYIFPDGTTMMVDAGESTFEIAPKPSSAVPAYEVYGNYIKHFLPEGRTSLDYVMLTHFHIDHAGLHTIREAGEGGYVHTGVSAVYDLVKFDRLIDRGYPTYEEDTNIGAPDTESMPNYRLFINKLESGKSVQLSRFEVGSTSQFALLYNPSSYKFNITNICGNAYVLGKGDDGKPVVTTKGIQDTGNANSCGFHLSYGNFDYIACGDLTSTPQNQMANDYYANYVTSLEVFKANHHLNSNSWGSGMKAAGFHPQVVTSFCNGGSSPDEGIVQHALSLPSDIFVTNLPEQTEVLRQIKGYDGHIVVRVAKGGGQFYVYMLDATDMSYNVKAIYGPYMSY